MSHATWPWYARDGLHRHDIMPCSMLFRSSVKVPPRRRPKRCTSCVTVWPIHSHNRCSSISLSMRKQIRRGIKRNKDDMQHAQQQTHPTVSLETSCIALAPRCGAPTHCMLLLHPRQLVLRMRCCRMLRAHCHVAHCAWLARGMWACICRIACACEGTVHSLMSRPYMHQYCDAAAPTSTCTHDHDHDDDDTCALMLTLARLHVRVALVAPSPEPQPVLFHAPR